MISDGIEDLWLDEEKAYAVVTTTHGTSESSQGRGMSHAEAMILAEGIQRAGKVATVMHIVGGKSYEVDRYPPR
jgi:hypothetical protein